MFKGTRYGKFPSTPIYKAFENHRHAEAFVNDGVFRMGALKQYRHIKDNRKDIMEGEGSFAVSGLVTKVHFSSGNHEYERVTTKPGLMKVHTTICNPIFIFSTFLPSADRTDIRYSYGPHIVEISDPIAFADQTIIALHRRPEMWSGLEGCCVEYKKGEVLNELPATADAVASGYRHKLKQLASQCEFRFVTLDASQPSERTEADWIELQIENPKAYLRYL